MSVCEKCWADAHSFDGGGNQADRYAELLRQVRDGTRRRCTPEEELGQWACERCGRDTRTPAHDALCVAPAAKRGGT